jgi:hypothetical protein
MLRSPLLKSLQVGVLAVLALAFSGCAVEADDERPAQWSKTTQPQTGSDRAEPAPRTRCDEGAQRDCQIIIDEANGVRSCWQGVQFCVEGLWSDCFVDDSEPTSLEPN